MTNNPPSFELSPSADQVESSGHFSLQSEHSFDPNECPSFGWEQPLATGSSRPEAVGRHLLSLGRFRLNAVIDCPVPERQQSPTPVVKRHRS